MTGDDWFKEFMKIPMPERMCKPVEACCLPTNGGCSKMSDQKIPNVEFENGNLFCAKSQEGDQCDIYETFDIFKQMEKYYGSICVVKHWKQRTMDTGEWVESSMKVGDAVFQMKEHWIERASFTLDT